MGHRRGMGGDTRGLLADMVLRAEGGMLIKIKYRFNGSVLFSLECGSLKLALEAAVKSGADLGGADLGGANLSRAKGINKYISTPLQLLRDQPGKIRAYKLVSADGVGPFNGGITFEVGKSYSVDDADTDETVQCGKGVNLATLDWCLREWKEGYRILVAEFIAKDVAAIPIGSDGKFRVHKCKIIGEKDLKELDWPPKPPEKAKS